MSAVVLEGASNSADLAKPPVGGAALRWIGRTPLAAIVALTAACSGAPEDSDVHTALLQPTSHETIYSGTQDGEATGARAVVAIKVSASPTASSFELCTGTMIAPNLLVTARHCVGKAVTSSVSCTEEGRSANGDHMGGELDPKTIQIYAGASPNFAGAPTALASKVFHPEGSVLCNADIAVVVLDRAIPSATPVPVRLAGGLRKGESIKSVGYGQNDSSIPVGTRLRKDRVSVLALGKTVSASKTPLGTREFEVGVSTCQGDSGGPALSEETGALVGVVSRGGECKDDFGHIYTTTSGFEDMFNAAFAAAGVPVNAEPAPNDDNVWLAQTRGQDGTSKGKHVGPSGEAEVSEESSASCSTSGRASHGALGGTLLALALAACVIRRRRAR
jgi:hypothetical protein